jgi:hypothetical protein
VRGGRAIGADASKAAAPALDARARAAGFNRKAANDKRTRPPGQPTCDEMRPRPMERTGAKRCERLGRDRHIPPRRERRVSLTLDSAANHNAPLFFSRPRRRLPMHAPQTITSRTIGLTLVACAVFGVYGCSKEEPKQAAAPKTTAAAPAATPAAPAEAPQADR